MAAIMIIPYVLATKGIFICGKKEGFVSVLVKGIENGTFERVVGSMKGFDIDPITTEITENEDAKPSKWGFVWMGSWPGHSAMVFEPEQAKIVNNDDGSLSLKVVQIGKTIHIPIVSTERLLIKGLETIDGATKVDFEVMLTYRMRNVYTAKIKNRGSTKILKSNVEEGLREVTIGLDYQGALRLKNATGPAELKTLVATLNASNTGFGPLTELTGYELISINIIAVELSGGSAEKIAEAYASVVIAAKAAEVKVIAANAEKTRLEREGEGKANAEEKMVAQVIRRIMAQKDMTAEQALAFAIEKTNAQVVTIGGNGPATLFNLDSKKTEPVMPPSGAQQASPVTPIIPPSGSQTTQGNPIISPSNKKGSLGKNKKNT